MTIKIKDIEDAVVEKITSHVDPIFFQDEQKYLKTDEHQRIFGEGFNKGVTAQGEVSLGLNRERLAGIIAKHWEALHIEPCLELADALIAAEGEIIEVKNG